MKIKKISIAIFSLLVLSLLLLFSGCCCTSGNATIIQQKENGEREYMQLSPEFNSDSTFNFIKAQVEFGPRIPNSVAHKECGDYLVKKLNEFGAEVIEQTVVLETYDKIKLNARNIIGVYNSINKKRILLFAHWDTRPFADEDKDEKRRHRPILGANDGASGVGVLLEIARQLYQSEFKGIGVDIIFFDAEDWGQPSYELNYIPGDWYCLGSQYWAKHPHVENYQAKFGILLDMVGAPNATFYKEGYSLHYASNIVEKIWKTGINLGYNKFFIDEKGGYITDDHVPINRLRRAPSVDIIHTSKSSHHGFGDYWHTHDDNMDVIDRETLKAVGQTVLELLFLEKK